MTPEEWIFELGWITAYWKKKFIMLVIQGIYQHFPPMMMALLGGLARVLNAEKPLTLRYFIGTILLSVFVGLVIFDLSGIYVQKMEIRVALSGLSAYFCQAVVEKLGAKLMERIDTPKQHGK